MDVSTWCTELRAITQFCGMLWSTLFWGPRCSEPCGIKVMLLLLLSYSFLIWLISCTILPWTWLSIAASTLTKRSGCIANLASFEVFDEILLTITLRVSSLQFVSCSPLTTCILLLFSRLLFASSFFFLIQKNPSTRWSECRPCGEVFVPDKGHGFQMAITL